MSEFDNEWPSDTILPGGSGDPRRQAERARKEAVARSLHASRDPGLIHGMTLDEVRAVNKRFDQMMPRLATRDAGSSRRDLFADTLPPGASWDPRRQASGYFGGSSSLSGLQQGGGGGDMHTLQRPYQPEFESPDRQQYPVHRILANRYWRLFIKMDPVLGTGLDMYGEMPWGEVKLTGEGVDGSVREAYEAMWEGCNINAILPAMVREYLGLGEVIPHCFPGDQQVLTSTGYRRIDSIQVGDEVITHLGRIRRVTETHPRFYEGLGFRFFTGQMGGETPVTCTAEHPFLTWDPKSPARPVWKRARDIHVGDHVAVQVDRTVQDRRVLHLNEVDGFSEAVLRSKRICPKRLGVLPSQIKIDEDLMRLFGYFFSEGFVTQDGIRFTFHEDESEYHADVQGILQKVFGLTARIDLHVDGTKTATVNLNSVPIKILFLSLFGTGACEKRVPAWMLTLPPKKQRAFLVGLFRGDGCLSHPLGDGLYQAILGLTNEQVIRAAWIMLHRLGVPASITKTKKPSAGNHEVWWCKFGTGSWGGLTRAIWPDCDPVIGTVEMSHAHSRKDRKGNFFYRVRGKEEIRLSEPVYNLEVEEDHSYVVHGVAAHNCFFSDEEGIWTHVALHNPDNLEVIDAPFIRMEPIIEFVPDDKLRQVLTSTDPELQKVRESLPKELLSRLYSRQNIRLNTEMNATFLARKLHPYETRGTSMLSRMWRVFMYEDAIFNASIATARRHAGPIKVAKLGNPQTNWIPGPEHERRFAELVAQAENDPHAWIIFHYGLSLEAFGTTDRMMTINREWEIIERIKLAAMGLSRSFLTGELTFASATAGLQVFLRRLLALRNFFESSWIRPKFFLPVARMNNFVKASSSELSHRIRVRRTSSELREDKRLIVPKLEWANKLNPLVDESLVKAYGDLEKMGFRISKTKKGASVNLGFEDELRKSLEEDKFEDEIRKKYGLEKEKGDPAEMNKIIDGTDPAKKDQQQAGPGQVAPAPPPNPRHRPPPWVHPKKQGEDEEGEREADAGPEDNAPDGQRSKGPAPVGGQWEASEVDGLEDLLLTGDTDSAFWQLLKPSVKFNKDTRQPEVRGYVPHQLLVNGQPDEAWQQVQDFLDDQGYPPRDIEALRSTLIERKVLPPSGLEAFEKALPTEPSDLSDAEFGKLFAASMEGAGRKVRG